MQKLIKYFNYQFTTEKLRSKCLNYNYKYHFN